MIDKGAYSRYSATLYLLVVCFLLPNLTYAGGGWVKVKGTSYWKLSQSGVSSDGYFAGTLGYSPTLKSKLLTTSFYFESGLGKKLSLEGYLPFYVNHSVDGSVIENGNTISEMDKIGSVGDVNIGLRLQLLKKDFLAISATATSGIPTGITEGGVRGNLFTGDGEFNQILRLDLSVPYGSKKIIGYSTFYGGHNIRQDPFQNEWSYGVETGIADAKSQVWLIARVNGVSSPSQEGDLIDQNGFTNSFSYSTYQIETSFYMDERMGLSASYRGAFNGDVILVSPSYSIGLFLDVK